MGKFKKSLIYITAAMLISPAAFAESLFQAGITQTAYPSQPKSLFSTVRAKTIGDVITVIVDENAVVSNDVDLQIEDSSSMGDNFSGIISDLFTSAKRDMRVEIPNLDNFGGSSETENTASSERTMSLSDKITAQVVQVLPNGNLVVQGKKVSINAGEKTQIILSGIVDPRFITNSGTVQSQNVANLQLAVVGSGTVSRHDREGLMNRVFGYLF